MTETAQRPGLSGGHKSPSPTADDIAMAIVLACRETGENPIAVMTEPWLVGKSVNGRCHFRARHYAFHVLHLAFPSLPRSSLPRLVGVTTSISNFLTSSNYAVIHRGSYDHRPAANWFSMTVLERITNTLRANYGQPPLPAATFWDGRYVIEEEIEAGHRFATDSPAPSLPVVIDKPARPAGPPALTAELMGDPSPDRCALSGAKPWRPYEAVCRDEDRYEPDGVTP